MKRLTNILFSFTLLFTVSPLKAKSAPKKVSVPQKVEQMYSGKKYKQVIALLDGKWSRANTSMLSYLASSYKELGQFSQEIKVLEYLKLKNEKQYIWYYKLGLAFDRLYMQTKKKADKEDSTKNFRLSIQKNPKFKPAYTQILKSFAAEGNIYEGRTMATTILNEFGSSPEVSLSLCKLYSLSGYIEETKVYCSQAIEESPKVGDSHMYLANSFLDKGDKVTAKKIFSKAAQNFKSSEFVQVTVGDYNFSESLYSAAFKNYKLALKINKKNKHAQVGMAQSLFKLQRPKRALAHYVEACRIDPRLKKEFKIAIGNLLSSGQDKVYSQYEKSLFKCYN